MEITPLYILLADDDEADRLIFTDAFSELDVISIVQTVKNGFELMGFLQNEHSRLPNILFLDLNMPGKNGLQLLKEIRANERFNRISLAIYSTSENEKDIEEAFLFGANIYITKPNDYNVLKQLLLKAIRTSLIYTKSKLDMSNFILKI